jgi:hypothetical protein
MPGKLVTEVVARVLAAAIRVMDEGFGMGPTRARSAESVVSFDPTHAVDSQLMGGSIIIRPRIIPLLILAGLLGCKSTGVSPVMSDDYQKYLLRSHYRAFVVTPFPSARHGWVLGWASGHRTAEGAIEKALEKCQKGRQEHGVDLECRLHSVGDINVDGMSKEQLAKAIELYKSNIGVTSYDTGIDMGVAGDVIVAAADGKVDYVASGANSELVILYHGRDANGLHLRTTYAYHDKLFVNEGELVERGQEIGIVGGSKRQHLHFGVSQSPENLYGVSSAWISKNPHDFWIDTNSTPPCYSSERPISTKSALRLTWPLRCQ